MTIASDPAVSTPIDGRLYEEASSRIEFIITRLLSPSFKSLETGLTVFRLWNGELYPLCPLAISSQAEISWTRVQSP